MSKRAEAVRIRLAEPDEREALEALQWRASLANPDDRPHLEAHPDAIDLPHQQIADGDVLVAETRGGIAGFAAVVGHELDGLFVEPDRWRQGIGAALVEAAAHVALGRGGALTVIANPAALGFYDRCGFVGEEMVKTRFGSGLRMSR